MVLFDAQPLPALSR